MLSASKNKGFELTETQSESIKKAPEGANYLYGGNDGALRFLKLENQKLAFRFSTFFRCTLSVSFTSFNNS